MIDYTSSRFRKQRRRQVDPTRHRRQGGRLGRLGERAVASLQKSGPRSQQQPRPRAPESPRSSPTASTTPSSSPRAWPRGLPCLVRRSPRRCSEVQGEILIERLIRQLKEAGIDDITVVVGYMKESFFYLEDKFGVKIAVSNDYSKRNNPPPLLAVKTPFRQHLPVFSDLSTFREERLQPLLTGPGGHKR